MERIIIIKTSLIGFPGKIISSKEISDIKKYFNEFDRKVQTLQHAFSVEKENEAKSKKPKSTETKERFRVTEELFEEVKTTRGGVFTKAKFLFSEYERRENEIFSKLIIPHKVEVILNDGRKELKELKEKLKESSSQKDINNINNTNANKEGAEGDNNNNANENKENIDANANNANANNNENNNVNPANANNETNNNVNPTDQKEGNPNQNTEKQNNTTENTNVNNAQNEPQQKEEDSVPKEPEEKLILEQVFLNTKMSTNDVAILKSKSTLDEEKLFISELFNLSELFPNCKSKQYIILDFYMNLYNLCIDNNFTLQQISTIMSIYFYIISYSFGWISTEKKICEIFENILNFHCLNNPPFTYKIYNQKQKKLLSDYFNFAFIKNFNFLEILFRHDINICFFNQVMNDSSKEEKIRKRKTDKNINKDNKPIQEDEDDSDEEEKEMEEKKEGDKSQDEIEDEKEIERMKNFVNSFSQAVGYLEMQKTIAENNAVLGRNVEEANQARLFLDMKVPEIKKDINEHVEVVTRNTLRPVEQEMAERANTKGGKK